MAIATNTMSLLFREQARESTAQSTLPSADAEARILAEKIARGDEVAFRKLYDAYHERLCRLALVLARGDESIAQDTVQSTFVTAAKKLRRVDGENHLWNWLARVARQHIVKIWRNQNRAVPTIAMSELPDCAEVPTPDSMLEESLDAALLGMDAEERHLIELFYFDRLSHREIAARFDLTPKAVSSRLDRAREKLRLLVAKKLCHET
jgi:RNA polymerase sigma factor (sigma-70 family)